MTLATISTLFLLHTAPSASAGEVPNMEDVMVDGETTVIYGEAGASICEHWSLSESATLRSHYITEFTIWEVVQSGNDGGHLVEGDTIQLRWDRSRYSDSGGGGCSTPYWKIDEESVQIMPVHVTELRATLDPDVYGDAGYETASGNGNLPPCGDDEYAAAREEREAEEADRLAEEEAEEELPPPWVEPKEKETGCQVASTAPTLLAGLWGLLGVARRRA